MRKGITFFTAVLATAAISPAAAFGHAAVTGRTPAPGSVVDGTKSVRITFAEAIVTGTLTIKKGSKLVGTGRLSSKKTYMEAKFSKELAAGTYTVTWKALADDGHHESGSWTFRDR
jgi:methionine-rich copper-binding protein CopC